MLTTYQNKIMAVPLSASSDHGDLLASVHTPCIFSDGGSLQLSFPDPIGNGNFGQVYKGVYTPPKQAKQTVAVKFIPTKRWPAEKVRREAQIMRTLYDNGVPVPKVYADLKANIGDTQGHAIIMEFIDGTSADHYEFQNNREIISIIGIQGLKAIQSAERCGVLVTDPKLEDIMVVDNDPDIPIRILDHGLSFEIRNLPQKASGTLMNAAPELFGPTEKRGTKNLIFSMGIMLTMLISFAQPLMALARHLLSLTSFYSLTSLLLPLGLSMELMGSFKRDNESGLYNFWERLHIIMRSQKASNLYPLLKQVDGFEDIMEPKKDEPALRWMYHEVLRLHFLEVPDPASEQIIQTITHMLADFDDRPCLSEAISALEELIGPPPF